MERSAIRDEVRRWYFPDCASLHPGYDTLAGGDDDDGTALPPAARACFYFKALSVTAWVQAPCGSFVITGSEPPDSSDFTVR
jgi:hypothetical protein